MAKKNGGMVKLKVVIGKLQKTLSSKKLASDVPEDVKEGHFAVIAADDEELRRFIIPVDFLARPAFLKLLEDAAEEYGFSHKGALKVPCQASELERLLAKERTEQRCFNGNAGANWVSYKAALWSC